MRKSFFLFCPHDPAAPTTAPSPKKSPSQVTWYEPSVVGWVSEKRWEPVRVSIRFSLWVTSSGSPKGDTLFETLSEGLPWAENRSFETFAFFWIWYPVRVLKFIRVRVLGVNSQYISGRYSVALEFFFFYIRVHLKQVLQIQSHP